MHNSLFSNDIKYLTTYVNDIMNKSCHKIKENFSYYALKFSEYLFVNKLADEL